MTQIQNTVLTQLQAALGGITRAALAAALLSSDTGSFVKQNLAIFAGQSLKDLLAAIAAPNATTYGSAMLAAAASCGTGDLISAL